MPPALPAISMATAPEAYTRSTHTTEMARGTHRLDIVGYGALLRRASPGDIVSSAPFRVGGYDWAIRFFPAGKVDAKYAGRVGLVVELLSDAKPGARAWYDIDIDGVALEPEEVVTPMILGAGQNRWGWLAQTKYIEPKDDRVTISCTIEVEKVSTATERRSIAVPPPNLSEQMLRFLESKQGADMTFLVEQREFKAHRLVLAVRSPNFNEQSAFGGKGDKAKEAGTRRVRIYGMKADVFEAVLRFIYTDESPPDVDRLLQFDCSAADGEDGKAKLIDKVGDLLAAAERFGLERLMVMCENALCGSLDAGNAAATLSLAERHHCEELKARCLEYMASPGVLKDVVATPAYDDIKDKCPSLVADLLEKLINCTNLELAR